MDRKVILITGGSRGLGAECVRTLSRQEGNTVYYTYSARPAEGQDGGNVFPVPCDQKEETAIADCVSKILNEQGRIDVLVNNACSSFLPCDFLKTDWSLFQELLDVNVRGACLFMREAAKAMKEAGSGKIINVLSSYVLNVPPEKLSHYVTAKYALYGLSKAAAAELGHCGVTVNMVSPGMMATHLTEYLPERFLQAYAQKHPMRRMTSTADVADVISFLCSDGARFLNGVNLPVNGGEAF